MCKTSFPYEAAVCRLDLADGCCKSVALNFWGLLTSRMSSHGMMLCIRPIVMDVINLKFAGWMAAEAECKAHN